MTLFLCEIMEISNVFVIESRRSIMFGGSVMKRTKIALSLMLACVMGLSLTACSGGKLSPSKLAKAAKAVGAEEYEPEDFADEVDDIDSEKDFADYSDGIYTSGKIDDVKKALKANYIEVSTKNVKEATVFYFSDFNKKDYSAARCVAVSLTYEDKESAQDEYDEYAGDIEDEYKEVKSYYDKVSIDDGEDGYEYTINSIEDDSYVSYYGVYLDGKTMFLVWEYSSGNTDLSGMADSICEEMGIIAPSEA